MAVCSTRASKWSLGLCLALGLLALVLVCFRVESPRFSAFALESSQSAQKVDSSQSSSRADTIGVAIHNSAPAESINQSRTFDKVRNLESVQGDWGVKGGIRGDASQVAPLSPLEKDLSQVTPKSSEKVRKVESSEQVDSSNEAMDCHALPSDTARNDRKADSSLDSRHFTIPNPTPSAHASTIIALDRAHLAQGVRESYGFMALFFAGSREGARDVGIYQSFFVKDSALGSHSRVSFLAKNGDCSGESAVTYDQVCALDSPCKAPFLSQKSFREQVVLENKQNKVSLENKGYRSAIADVSLENPQNSHSPTAKRSFFRKQATAVQGEAAAGFFRSPRILENAGQTKKLDSSFAPSSRAFEKGEAIHNSAPAESINQSRGTRNLESVQGDWGVKGGIRGDASQVAPLSPLEKNSSQTKLESSKKAQKVESTFAKIDSSERVESMDCHATASAVSRNDKNSNNALDCHADKNTRNDRKIDSTTAKNLASQAPKALCPKPLDPTLKWSEPREILSPSLLSRLSGKFIAKLGNPVSFVDTRGRVHLFVVGVSLGGWATSRVYWLEFDESLEHLHFRQELALSPFANLSFLVRAPAVLLEDGGFVLPVYHELARKYPLLLHFDAALKLDSITKPLATIGAKSHSKLQPSFTPLSPTTMLGVYRNYTPSTMQVSLCELASTLDSLHCQSPKPSNLINYNSSSIVFSIDGLVFLLHNSPPPNSLLTQPESKLDPKLESKLESPLHKLAQLDSSAPSPSPILMDPISPELLELALPKAREQLWLFVLDTAQGERVEFVPLALLDSVESSEVSYPSVALSLEQVHIAYTYKRAYIKSLLFSKSALVQSAQETLSKRKQARFYPQVLESSLRSSLDSSKRDSALSAKMVRDD